MRLIELEIDNIRGITHIELHPNGSNFAVWGPNGSGKSAVVDALDFLLTGEITRLTGTGTGNITLTRHGPHIDHRPDDAKVRGVIKVHGLDRPIEISRCIAHPNEFSCNDDDRPYLNPLMELAKRGQHVLTRKEILRYITAEGGKRAEQIQTLLNLSEIEEIRKSLVKVQTECKKGLDVAIAVKKSEENKICATTSLGKFDENKILETVNQKRSILGGEPVTTLTSSEIKKDIRLPVAITGEQAINATLVQADLNKLMESLSDQKQSFLLSHDQHLRKLLTAIREDPILLRDLNLQQLLRMGSQLIDESGSCPLCETTFPPGELKNQIDNRLLKADATAKIYASIMFHSSELQAQLSTTASIIQKLSAVSKSLKAGNEFKFFAEWETNINRLIEGLISPLEKYPIGDIDTNKVGFQHAPEDASNVLNQYSHIIKENFPEATPERTAWDTLNLIEDQLHALEIARARVETNELFTRRASILLDEFLHSRDAVLSSLYDSVRNRFVELYKKLHNEDEANFDARLQPNGPALDLEVSFYGRGPFPPHALHSEGHQDSMGLCLYLALAEKLTRNQIDLIILDDVVMSVDAEHRRQVCNMLATTFPDRQFLITTHDRTWANQLKTEGVIKPKELIEFYNWSVEFGPQLNLESEIWELIEQDLGRNDIANASLRLRRGSEEFFSSVCDALQTKVVFKLNGRWELGELLPEAIGQYRKILTKAKVAANSWDQRDTLGSLVEIDSIAAEIFLRTNAEQWAINPNIHYNKWTDFSPEDFRPVVEAFRDLFDLFRCTSCRSILYLLKADGKATAVKCNCGKVTWNLIGKEKE